MTDEMQRWWTLWKETLALTRQLPTLSDRNAARKALFERWRYLKTQGKHTSHNITARRDFRLYRDNYLGFVGKQWAAPPVTTSKSVLGIHPMDNCYQELPMNTTIRTEISAAPAPTTKAFKDFAVGDWLLTTEGQAFGVKIDSVSVKFYQNHLGNSFIGSSGICTTVQSTTRYIVPSWVDIKVTR